MNSGTESDMPVRSSLKVKLFRIGIGRRVHIRRRQHDHDLVAFFNRTPPSSVSLRT